MKKFISIVPFYPLEVLRSEDYFLLPALMMKKQGYTANIYAFAETNSAIKWVEYAGVPVHYFKSPLQMIRYIPQDAVIHCQGMTRKMVELYILLYSRRHKSIKVITPHTSFGVYEPWGKKINYLPLLKPLLKQFRAIYTITPHEFDFYQSYKLKQAFPGKLAIDYNFFHKLGEERIATDRVRILCMGGTRKVKNIQTISDAILCKDWCKRKYKLTVMDVGDQRVDPYSDEYARMFRNNDLFVNSSYMEGFSLGVAEAAASGMALCLSSQLPTLFSVYQFDALYHEPDNYDELFCNIKRARPHENQTNRSVWANKKLMYGYRPEQVEKELWAMYRGIL